MVSPFPGMDPYLEDPRMWKGFHDQFLTYLAGHLNESLPVEYYAGIEERVIAISTAGEPPDGSGCSEATYRVDVGIVRPSDRKSLPAAGAGATRGPAIVELPPPSEALGDWLVEIRTAEGDRLVAVIECLSPWNKVDPGRKEYLAKREAILWKGDGHLVEIDLLRAGRRLPMASPLPPGDYYVLLSRAEFRPRAEAWAITVRDPLPEIPVPLLGGREVPIALQSVIDETYDRGAYARRLDYAGSPPPTGWAAEQAEWIAARAKSRVAKSGE